MTEETTQLLQEVNDLLAEFFGSEGVPPRTADAVAEGKCRLIEADELANSVDDIAQGAASSPPS